MNLILFELRRMSGELCLMLLTLIGLPLMLVINFTGDATEKNMAVMIPVCWLLIALNSVGKDREQAAFLGGMPVTLWRVFLTRFLVRLTPVVILTAVFWLMIGGGRFRPELLEFTMFGNFTWIDSLGVILAVGGIVYFFQLSDLRPEMSIGKMVVLILALLMQPVSKSFYWFLGAGEYAFFLTCAQAAVLAFIGSWEIWRSVYLNERFRWRVVFLMLLPLAQSLIVEFITAGEQ